MRQTTLTGEVAPQGSRGRGIPQGCGHFVNSPHYKDRQLVLERADYITNSSGDKIRAEIKGKCEWGEHFQI